MAGNIKGITIEIDGNTTPLQKALNNVNKEVRDTQKELREVDRLLKLDPKNVELLTQKQKLLDKAVQDINKKLDTEKEALKALQEADQSEEVTRKMGQLESQIKKDEEALLKARKAVNDFGDVGKQQALAVNAEFEKMGKTIKEKGDQIQEIGKNITTHVTAPIMAVGGAALAAFGEVDAGYDTVIQKTGAAGDAAEEMYDIVNNLATSIPTDFATAGEAVGEVNTRFGLTGDALEDLAGQFVKFAQLNDTDVTSSVDSVQKAMAAFNVPAEEASGYLDALNKAAQDSGIGIDTLTSLTVNNATALQDMGLSLDESTALMAQLEKSGAPVEAVMGGLSKALKQAAKDGKPLDQALEELQESITGAESDTEGLQAAYELFGKSGDKVFQAIKNGALDLGELGNTAGSVSDTFEATLDPIDQWQLTLNELKLAGAELGATIGEVVAPMLQDLASVVSDLRAKWGELSPQQQEMIVQMAGIAAVIGPIVAIIGSIVSGIGGLIASMTTIATVFGTTIGVVAGVAAGITALIAVIALLILNWDKVKAKVQEVWTNVSATVGQLKDDIKAKFDEIKQNVSEKISQVKQDMSDKWNQIKSDVAAKVTGMKNDIVNKLIELKNSAVEKLNDIKAKFKEKFDDIKEKVKGVIDDIKGFFSGLTLKFPKIEMPKLPHFKLTGDFSLNPPSVPHLSVDWYAKAMDQPYVFTQPTVMQTPYGYIGAGEAGKEIMYGYDSLMRDITAANAANNSALERGVYNAMVAALQTGDFTIQIGNREFARILREAGAL